MIARNARNLWRSSADIIRGRPSIAGDEVEEFWALRDVAFEVERGEVVGVIGRNGAGKSTLLKILSRITEPTEGRVEIRGRVASLLEVGTGFHPELTGRENIYLNGAILGMTRAEIRRKFDEIVAFAEVERFLDTPVKRYSSGMYVRLAFAVAAHLEPEILIVDEVLAVGDAEFQKKCLGKMGEVAGEGRTVLFVSHNMASVASLCKKGILLDRGRIIVDSSVADVLSHYSAIARSGAAASEDGAVFRRPAEAPISDAGVVRVEIVDGAGAPVSFVESFGRVILRAVVSTTRPMDRLSVIFWITSAAGDIIAKFESNPKVVRVGPDPGSFTVECDVRNLPLVPDEYRLSVGVAEYMDRMIEHHDVGTFSVTYASDKDVQMKSCSGGLPGGEARVERGAERLQPASFCRRACLACVVA